MTLAAFLTEQNDETLADSIRQAPASVRLAARKRLPTIRRALAGNPQALEQFELALS